MRFFSAGIFLILLCAEASFAWNNHGTFTRMALMDIPAFVGLKAKDRVAFEPITNYYSIADLEKRLQVHADKIDWNWGRPPSEMHDAKLAVIEVLAFSSDEPDRGMDQNLVVDSRVQPYMGGFTGPSSQGFRHMFYPEYKKERGLVSAHVPFKGSMGHAPDRFQLYLELASEVSKKGSKFWKYRFLGWALHYIQDLGQPYHTTQFGGFRFLGLGHFYRGWSGIVAETARRIGNFHLSFELWTERKMMVPGMSFGGAPAPAPFAGLANPEKQQAVPSFCAQGADWREAIRVLIDESQGQVAEIIDAQNSWYGDLLMASNVDLVSGLYDSQNRPKLDLSLAEARQDFKTMMFRMKLEREVATAVLRVNMITRCIVEKYR